MQFWCDDDRPDTKLLLKGKNSLSDAELLSVIIGSIGGESGQIDHLNPDETDHL